MTRVPTSVHAASAAPAPAKPGALADFLHDIDRLFVPPRPLPTPAERARKAFEAIDWNAPIVVIWVPGTNGVGVPEHVAALLRANGVPVATAIDYQATWQFRDSVPDGELVLRELLQLAARQPRRPGQRIVLLGESQGAWIISSILRDPQLAAIVYRAGLVAHPALAPAHAHAISAPTHRLDQRTREFNAADDVVTRDVGRSADRVLDVVDSFARLEVGRALTGALRIAVSDFGLLQALVASQLFRVKGTDNPHGSDDLMRDAVQWVLGASDAPDRAL